MTETRIHPVTGKFLIRGVRPQVVSVGTTSLTFEVPGWYPAVDSDSLHSGEDLRGKNEVLGRLREEQDGS